jgi:Glycosyltransferase family 9 (heptosyltransferase)
VQIVTFGRDTRVNFRKSSAELWCSFKAGVDYVMSHHHWERMMQDPAMAPAIQKFSVFEPRVRQFRVDPHGGAGQDVLFHCGCGGFGDQLMMWPVVRWLAEGAGYRVHVLTDFKGNEACWWHFPWITSLLSLPQPIDFFNGYDEVCLFEQVTNGDEHPGQRHPTDAALWRMGFDPRLLPSSAKRVEPHLTEAERALAKRFVAGRRIAIYQPSATSPARTLPADVSKRVLEALARAFPEHHWLSLVDSFVPDGYRDVPALPNVEVICFPSLRHLFAVAELAEIGVGPDSLLAHVMGAWARPCVGLWGSTDPATRVRYYPNHAALQNRSACPYAPCRVCRLSLPPYCPTAATGWCGAIPVDVEAIVSAARSLLDNFVVNKNPGS